MDPHQLTLGSVAESFNQEDYEPAPPGVDPRLWNDMIRKDRIAQRRGTGGGAETSLLDEQQQYGQGFGDSTTTDSLSYVEQHDSHQQQQSQQPSNSHTGNSINNTTSTSQAYYDEEQSRSTEQSADRTELLSERLPRGGGDSTMNRSSELGDETGGGGDSALLKRATINAARGGRGSNATGNLGNGQNMTLREQEKVKPTLFSFLHSEKLIDDVPRSTQHRLSTN
jgi:hypothetical protein